MDYVDFLHMLLAFSVIAMGVTLIIRYARKNTYTTPCDCPSCSATLRNDTTKYEA